jgi:glucose dehydrogenase
MVNDDLGPRSCGMAKWVYQMTPHDEWDYDGRLEGLQTELSMLDSR